MPRYILTTNFDHIKGDSWIPDTLKYRYSFLEETQIDYQPSLAPDLVVVPSNPQEEQQALTIYSRFAPENRVVDNRYPHSDWTCISLARHHFIQPYLSLENYLQILERKARRLVKDFNLFEERVVETWKANFKRQIGRDHFAGGTSYFTELHDHLVNWKTNPEFIGIKKQLDFEREVFYWSNIKGFEQDYDQLFPSETLKQARDIRYNEPYYSDESRESCERVCHFTNPFVYPSDDHYRFWCHHRDTYWNQNPTHSDTYWDIETSYIKELTFVAGFPRFIENYKFGFIPDDLELRSALDQERNS